MRFLIAICFSLAVTLSACNSSTSYEEGVKFYESKDYARASSVFQKAAERGDAAAQYNLGVMYDRGEGVAHDPKQAVAWYRKAAEQGHASAQYLMGIMYDIGKEVAQDPKQAVSWWQKAAEQRNAAAQYKLGFMYNVGRGVEQDNTETLKWWNIASANGNEDAKKGRDILEKKMSREQIAEAQRRSSEWLKARELKK
jgi:TPR repeat protein